jgi:hypothetical protein
MKKFMSGLLIGLLLSITIVTAAVNLTAVESTYSTIFYGVKVALAKPIVTVNGEYYFPAKQVSDALGINFVVNDVTKTLEFGPKPTSHSSISNPVNINTPLTINYSDFINSYIAEVQVKDIIRGEQAWKMVREANSFNDTAPEGREYLLAKINFRLLDIADGKALDLNHAMFDLVSSEGREYGMELIVAPDPTISANLYKGASNEGWAVFLVGINDINPKITFGRNYDGTGGIWFKAYK